MESSSVEELLDKYEITAETVQEILDMFADVDEVDSEEVIGYTDDFLSYGVTNPSELQNAVLSKVSEQYDVEIETSSSSSSDDIVPISSLTEPKDWVTVVAKVVQLYDNDVDSIFQVGLIDDGTTTKATVWEKADAPTLEEGKVYEFRNVITNEYEGDINIEVNSQSEIVESDEEIAASGEEVTFEGSVVSVHNNSGLIARDPESGQTVDTSKVNDYEDDLRLMTVMDDGEETYKVVFDAEMTEDLTGIDLERATEMATEAIDREVVRREMKPMVLGRYFTVTGPRIGNYLYVEEYETGIETEDVDSLLVKARTLNEQN